MTRGLTEKKFEANVPLALWEAYEHWAKGRAKIPNTQLMEALFRLFLAAPEGVKLLALYGRGDQLARAAEFREDFLAAEILDDALADAAAHSETPATTAKAPKRSGRRLRRQTG